MDEHIERALRPAVLSDVAALARELSIAKQLESSLVNLDYLSAEKYLERFEKVREKLRNVETALEQIDFGAIHAQVSVRAKEQRIGYEIVLVEELKKLGISVNGSWPMFIVGGLLRLAIDLRNVSVSVDGAKIQEKLPEAVAKHLKGRLDAANKGTDVATLFDDLEQVYLKAQRDQDDVPGGYLDIRLVYKLVRAAKPKRPTYTTTQFAIDIYRIKTFGGAEASRIELSPAQNASTGLYVPSVGGGNYIAAIRIQPKTNHG